MIDHLHQSSTQYETKLIRRLFFSLMPAAILICATGSINTIVDGIIASNVLGETAISAIGFTTPLLFVLTSVTTMMMSGTMILIGGYLGKGDKDSADMAFSTDLLATFTILGFISFFCLAFSPLVAKFLGASQEARRLTSEYIRGASLSFIPVFLATHFSSVLELEQRHLRNFLGIGVLVVTNIICDYLFVIVLPMGCFGLGLSTTVSGFAYLLVLIQYYFSSMAQLKFNLRSFKAATLLQIIKIGAPGALTQAYLALRAFVLNKTVFFYEGEIGVAAWAAVNSFGALFYAFTNGIATATRTLFSLFVGAEDRNSLKTTLKVVLTKAFPLDLALSTVLALMAPFFTRLYFQDSSSEVYRLTMILFAICPFAMSFSTFSGIYSALFQCQKRMVITNIISFVEGVGGMLLSMAILCPLLGIYGVWLSWFTMDLVVVLFIVGFLLVHYKHLPRTVDEWMAIPEGFGATEDMRMNMSVHNEEDVITCSEEVIAFLSGRGVEEKKAYYAGLCLEEMASNIISYGYGNDKKNHSAVLEITDFGDRLVLRIMDDCRAFDPLERDIYFHPEDPTKNIGIRIVTKLSQKVEYHRMVGLNVLTIVL